VSRTRTAVDSGLRCSTSWLSRFISGLNTEFSLRCRRRISVRSFPVFLPLAFLWLVLAFQQGTSCAQRRRALLQGEELRNSVQQQKRWFACLPSSCSSSAKILPRKWRRRVAGATEPCVRGRRLEHTGETLRWTSNWSTRPACRTLSDHQVRLRRSTRLPGHRRPSALSGARDTNTRRRPAFKANTTTC